jgi:hypothetical protein
MGNVNERLIKAIKFNDTDVFELVEKCNSQYIHSDTKSLLYYACEYNRVEIALSLIQRKCDIFHECDSKIKTSFEMACKNHMSSIIENLLPYFRPIALLIFCKYNNIKHARKLIPMLTKDEINIEINNFTPIRYACENMNVEMATTLINCKCSLTQSDLHGGESILGKISRRGVLDKPTLIFIDKMISLGASTNSFHTFDALHRVRRYDIIGRLITNILFYNDIKLFTHDFCKMLATYLFSLDHVLQGKLIKNKSMSQPDQILYYHQRIESRKFQIKNIQIMSPNFLKVYLMCLYREYKKRVISLHLLKYIYPDISKIICYFI